MRWVLLKIVVFGWWLTGCQLDSTQPESASKELQEGADGTEDGSSEAATDEVSSTDTTAVPTTTHECQQLQFHSALGSCYGCHGINSEVEAPRWLPTAEEDEKGEELFGVIKAFLSSDQLVYENPLQNYFIGKISPEVAGLGHGGGKAFGEQELTRIQAMVALMEKDGCVKPQHPLVYEDGSNLGLAFTGAHPITFRQLRANLLSITKDAPEVANTIDAMGHRLGRTDYAVRKVSNFPIRVDNLAELDQVLAFTCDYLARNLVLGQENHGLITEMWARIAELGLGTSIKDSKGLAADIWSHFNLMAPQEPDLLKAAAGCYTILRSPAYILR